VDVAAAPVLGLGVTIATPGRATTTAGRNVLGSMKLLLRSATPRYNDRRAGVQPGLRAFCLDDRQVTAISMPHIETIL
jgi:hypothetical protein